jgi:drug/metabolite transporter (DMT)-like permease
MPPSHESAARRERLIGYVCAGMVVAIWAGFSLMSRYSARGGAGVRLTPWDLGALRFSVAGVVALAMWGFGIGRGFDWRRGVVLAALAGFGFAIPSYLGFTFAPAAHGALVLSGTLPFLVAIGAWLMFHERWSRARQLSLVVLLVGIGLFALEAYGRQQAPPGAWRGDLLFMVAAVAWSSYTIMVRRWAPTPTQSIVAVGLGCAVVYLPVWWVALPSRLVEVPLTEVLLQALFQGVFAVLISLWLYIRALNSLGAGRLTTITALVPGTAAVLAAPLLGEPLGLLSATGLLLVIVAVLVGMGHPAPTAIPAAGN